MKIAKIQSSPLFKGQVYQDKNTIQQEISKCPLRIRESLQENIDTLTERIKNETPKDARFKLEFYETQKQQSVYDPTYYYGLIKVRNLEGKSIQNGFSLGNLGGSAKDAKSVLVSNETMKRTGFDDITQRILNGALYENGIESLENSYKYKKMNPETKELAKYSFSRLNESEKIVMNKARNAIGIAKAVNGCPDEVIETVINGINTLISELENNTPQDKMFYIDVIGGDCPKTQELNITVGEYRLQGNDKFEGSPLIGKHHSVNRFIATRYIPDSSLPYCVTNSEYLYEEIFKPITDKMLEIANK